MLTPQEVANCTFSKAVMGGYNMAAVDDFLDKLTEDYTTLYKDNAALKAKMKVLVDKMEEYREIEDAMRSTLLAAQKTANSIVAEAEGKRDAIIADAAGGAKERLAEIRQELEREEERLQTARAQVDAQIEAEQRRLTVAQEELRGFIAKVQDVCARQVQLLESLPELPAAPVEPVAPVQCEAPVQELAAEEESAAAEDVPARADETVLEELKDIFSAIDKEQAPAQSEEDLADIFAADHDGSDVDMASTRKINLDDLQFGKNYIKE